MLSTIIHSATRIRALKCARPLLDDLGTIIIMARLTTTLFFCSIMARYIFLNLATVAARWNSNLTRSTRAIVTWLEASVLPARHD